MKKILIAILAVIALIIIWIVYDFVQNDKIERTQARTELSRTLNLRGDDIMIALEEGESVDFDLLEDTLTYIDGRYDCSDFRVVSLIRILYDHDDKLPESTAQALKESLTSFKYWMDQPGDDSMCYWSENHQILFSSAEYLLGHYYADETFSNMNIKVQSIVVWEKKEYWLG